MIKKIIEPYNIHLDAFWEKDIPKVERMLRKLDPDTLKKLYGMTINITDKDFFPHPKTGEPMTGLTRSLQDKPYLIILSKDPDPRRLYHEVAHTIGIDDETKAMEFATRKMEKSKKLAIETVKSKPPSTNDFLAVLLLIGLPLSTLYFLSKRNRYS